MTKYFSTYLSGVSEVIETALKNSISDVNIKMIDDTFVLFESSQSLEKICNLRFLNNTYLYLGSFNFVSNNTKSINNLFKQATNDPNIQKGLRDYYAEKKVSLRIIVSFDNQMVSPDKNILTKLENRILENTNLRIERSLPDSEIWFVIRHQGDAYMGIRITRHGNYEKILQKGQLRPEIAHIMSLISQPESDDVFLDPFCGFGSIPIERSTSFPYKRIIASDIDKIKIDFVHEKLQGNTKDFNLLTMDATNMKEINEGSINKIVTDPIWGVNQGIGIDLSIFYSDLLKEFYRILQDNGLAVLLLSREGPFIDTLKKYDTKFKLVCDYKILVAGQKATIYKLVKV